MSDSTTSYASLSTQIIVGVDRLITDAEAETKPLEVSPYRERLFEFFVTAHGAGLISDDSDDDLSADGLCNRLAARWGLGHAARQSAESQTKLSERDLAKMRSLWSVMRMWMEWDYAWKRWSEFHPSESADDV